MPAKSVAQRRFMAMCEHGKANHCPDMSKSQVHDFASTSEKGLPKRIEYSKARKALHQKYEK